MNSQEMAYAQGLSKARAMARANSPADAAKKLGRAVKLMGNPLLFGFRLFREIDFARDWVFLLMGGIALFKDLLDFTTIGSLPLLGWIVTTIFYIAMGGCWLLAIILGVGKYKKVSQRIMKQGITFFLGEGVETFFVGANLLPVATGTVVIMYILELIDRVINKKD